MLQTPLLLLVYNRLDTLQKVGEAIRLVRSRYFFISGDGPREDPRSQEAITAVRHFCEKNINWPCEAHFQWLPTNHGHEYGVLKGISWFFSQVSKGIVLEDDNLPIPDFFPFCETLLEQYRGDRRIQWGFRPIIHLTNTISYGCRWYGDGPAGDAPGRVMIRR